MSFVRQDDPTGPQLNEQSISGVSADNSTTLLVGQFRDVHIGERHGKLGAAISYTEAVQD
jgi:hypothetical protein